MSCSNANKCTYVSWEVSDALFNFELDTEAERTCQVYSCTTLKAAKVATYRVMQVKHELSEGKFATWAEDLAQDAAV